jgi:hypothetical protein
MAMRRNTAAGELLASDVCGADDEVAAVGLVDEQPGLAGFGDAQLDRLVAWRRHQDRAADGERTAK